MAEPTGPPFFIVGSARSGTTMLRLLLNAHSEVAVPPESRFVTELWRGQEEVDTAALLAKLAAHKRFQQWDLPIQVVAKELPDEERLPYSMVIEAAYRAYARVHRKSRWGDKTPRYVEQIPLIARMFPTARFVHLIRDGRDVALSYKDVPFGPTSVAKAARLWRDRVAAGIRDGRSLEAGRYLELRYEDLVEDVKTSAEDLCAFLGLDFDPGMLEYTERARDAVLPRAAKYNPHVTEAPKGRARSWERDMPAEEIETFEAIAGDALVQAGYARACPHPSLKARLRAKFSGARGFSVDLGARKPDLR